MQSAPQTKSGTFYWQREDGRAGEGYISRDDDIRLRPAGQLSTIHAGSLERRGARYQLIVSERYRKLADQMPNRFDSRTHAGRWIAKRLELAGIV
jgi:hypothetical protein